MSEKYVKIQSQQNADFTTTNNRVDFIIPASMGKISLRDSFVQLYVRATIPEDNVASGTGVYMASLFWKNGGAKRNNYFNNVACIKNASISSANKGSIESCRRVDILRQNLSSMRKSESEVDSDRYITGDALRNLKNEQQYSIFQQINKLGDVASKNNDNVPLTIRLGDILNFCDSDIVDLGKMGDTKIHLELNVDKIGCYQVFPKELVNSGEVDDVAQPAASLPLKSLILTTEFTHQDQIPFYVGQKIVYSATTNGQNGQSYKAVIKSITQAADGVLTLEFADALVTLTTTGGGASNGVVTIYTPAAAAAGTVQWNMAEVVLKEVSPDTPSMENVMYNQWDTYELLGNGAKAYTNVVEVDGASRNALIMPVDTVNGLDATLVVDDFRIALNNVELTDTRSVVPYTPLYYDRLIKAMGNSDYVVRNLQNPLYEVNAAELYKAERTSIIGMPLFPTTNRKNLQININTSVSAGLGQYILYCAVPRVMAF